jgi:hypothetical protein
LIIIFRFNSFAPIKATRFLPHLNYVLRPFNLAAPAAQQVSGVSCVARLLATRPR